MRVSSRAGPVICVAVLAFLGGAVHAQVVREEGVANVAGVLGGPAADVYDDFTFDSAGGEVLAVSVDQSVYQAHGGSDHDDGSSSGPDDGCDGATGGGCDDEGGGCAGGDSGGPGLCLQVIDSGWRVLCWASRPAKPGWQRDPRLICLLPTTHGKPEEYTLRVGLRGDDCAGLFYPDPEGDEPVPYVLGVSLRRIAPEGSLTRAVALSKNRI